MSKSGLGDLGTLALVAAGLWLLGRKAAPPGLEPPLLEPPLIPTTVPLPGAELPYVPTPTPEPTREWGVGDILYIPGYGQVGILRISLAGTYQLWVRTSEAPGNPVVNSTQVWTAGALEGAGATLVSAFTFGEFEQGRRGLLRRGAAPPVQEGPPGLAGAAGRWYLN